jgi:hypothetical protein
LKGTGMRMFVKVVMIEMLLVLTCTR